MEKGGDELLVRDINQYISDNLILHLCLIVSRDKLKHVHVHLLRTLENYTDLVKWVLFVPDHDLRPDQEQEADQTVHVTQPEVAEGAVPDVGHLSNIKLESGLQKILSINLT